MEVAILLYRGMTALDAIGPYEVLRMVPDYQVKTVALTPGPVQTDAGLWLLNAEYQLEEVGSPQIIVVPGASDIRPLLKEKRVIEWLQQAHVSSRWTISVCSGALLLGQSGLLKGHKATTHWLAHESLRNFGAEPVKERIVRQGKIITAAGVSAGIDLALSLVALDQSEELARSIQLAIEYDPQPSFDSGNPSQVEPVIIERARQLLLRSNSPKGV